MTVREFCTREVVIASHDSSILEVAQLMRQHHVGDVVIVDSKKGDKPKPVGIITDRDIVVELLAKEVSLDTVSAGDVMSFELKTIRESDSIWDALQLMRIKGIRRIPVVNDQGGLEGILTVDDLLELLAEELMLLARVPFREQSIEKETKP